MQGRLASASPLGPAQAIGAGERPATPAGSLHNANFCVKHCEGSSVFFATDVTGPVSGSGTLTGSCGDNPGLACRLAWDITHSTDVAQVVRVYLAGSVSQGPRILFFVVVALVIRAAAHRVINKITERAATATLPV